MGFPGGSVVNNPPPMQETGDAGSILWGGKIPWRRKWQPTPAFLPGESHGQRILAGYSPWGHKEPDTTEQLSTYIVIFRQEYLLQPRRIYRINIKL